MNKLINVTFQTLSQRPEPPAVPAKIFMNRYGQIFINTTAVSLLAAEEGAKVSFTYEEEEPNNWYIYIDTEHGFELKSVKSRRGPGFQSMALSKKLRAVTGKKDSENYEFMIGGKATDFGDDKKYFGILIPAE